MRLMGWIYSPVGSFISRFVGMFFLFLHSKPCKSKTVKQNCSLDLLIENP